MCEFGSFLPGKGFSPYAEGSIFIESFIEGIIDSLVMDVDGIFDEHLPPSLPFLILIVWLNFDSPHEDFLEGIKDLGSEDIAFVVLV